MIKFRIYPEDKSLYFLIHIYDTKKDLQAKIKKFSQGKLDKRTRARVSPFDVVKVKANGVSRKQPILGMVLFWKDDIGTNVITHEFFHATSTYARRVGLDFEKDEERLATVHGQMCAKFVKKCYDKGVYD